MRECVCGSQRERVFFECVRESVCACVRESV